MTHKTLIIIPAYNEEASLSSTVNALLKTLPNADFIIVNDGSNDHTAQICRQNSFKFADLPVNLGLSGAFQTGIKYAHRHGYDACIQFDADGQHLPEYINPLINALPEYDIVIGSRFVSNKKPKTMRMVGSNLLSGLIKLTTGEYLTDPTSGMRAFNKRMIELLATNLNMGPEPDTISYLIKRAGAKVGEVPVEMSDRVAGESYLNAGTSMKYMLRMIVSILVMQYYRKPI